MYLIIGNKFVNIIEKNVKKESSNNNIDKRVSENEAMQSIKTLLRWIGEDPDREGLLETPKRVLKAYKEWFAGYNQNPKEILSKTFEEVGGYDGMIVLSDIRFSSYCEHHIAPISGKVSIGYLPKDKVVGLSKLARLVDVFSKRLQVQERMTAEIANALQSNLECKGVGVLVEAEHHCMCTRGVNKLGTSMKTSYFTGVLKKDLVKREEFISSIT